MSDSLRRNSSLLIISQGINAAGGFIFWIVCVHLFKPSIIGIATSFVSFAALASTFTNLGLPNTIVRFLPTSKKRAGMFAAAFYIVFFASVIFSFAALLLIKVLVPRLGLVQSSFALSTVLVILISGTAISSLLDGTLMAFRKGEYILGKALIINIPRVVLPFFVVSLGIKGITGVYAIVLIAAVSYNLIIVTRKLLNSSSFKPTLAEIKKHRNYALGNYLGGMFGMLPGTVVPLIVLSKLGPESAAYFYMPMQITAFLGIISSSISQALISESSQSHDEISYKRHFRNAFKHLFQILLPAITLLCLFGWPLLKVYGNRYVDAGLIPLLILASASVFVGINWLGDTWLNIKKQTSSYFLMNAFNSIAVIGFVYIFASHGLIAVGVGWLLGQLVSALVYLVIFGRNQLLPLVGTFSTSS